MTLTSIYYDGRTSTAWPAELSVQDDRLIVQWGEKALSYPLNTLHVLPAVGRLPRRIDLPDGGALEVADGPALSVLLGEKTAWVQRWESSLRLALLALPLLLLSLWAGYRWGLPILADAAAPLVPPASERWLANETLSLLDDRWLKPSKLAPAKQQAVQSAFRRMLLKHPTPYRYTLQFRSGGPLKANAFALPGGVLIMTDELVGLARNENELLAILAHEMGHVEHRHGVKGILRSSGLGVALALLTGDVSSVGGGLAALPLALAELRYSRDLERDADAFALELMQRSAISPCHFPSVLQRLAGSHDPTVEVPDWLTTHPNTSERLMPFEHACREKSQP